MNLTPLFLYAGRASFVVRNPQNESVTVKLSKSKSAINPRTGQPWPTTFFVSLRFGNDAWQYVGNMRQTDRLVNVSPKITRTDNIIKAIAVAEWAVAIINGEKSLPASYTIEHTGRCGVCYKMLRDPESIALGIGPVCRA